MRATVCYMRSVTHRELRNESGAILRAVAAGETIQVTNGGQVAAVIAPPSSKPLDQLEVQGQVRPARRPIADLALVRRHKPSRSSAELIADSRGRW
jgi:antitoxin (DNA-binding transcriptional repressor) of toxin-antitoxin stability system